MKKLLRSLQNLQADLKKMEKDEDYNIFDEWEIGEVEYVIQGVTTVIQSVQDARDGKLGPVIGD